MIHILNGILISKTPSTVVIDISGVGYGVDVPQHLASEAQLFERLKVYIHTYVREDLIKLFGFRCMQEKRLFCLLISVSGVGPKVAMSMLSTLTVDEIVSAVLCEKSAVLECVPGIGARQSKKIVLELKPKVESQFDYAVEKDQQSLESPKLARELDGALANLGYKDRERKHAISNIDHLDQLDFSDAFKKAVAVLSGQIDSP